MSEKQMADVALNSRWNLDKNWESPRGEHWSKDWGSVDMQWAITLRPRLQKRLAGAKVLEVGCGHGRWYQSFIASNVHEYHGIDFNSNCVDYCSSQFNYRARWTTIKAAEPWPVEPLSVDIVFSWDSLVYASQETLQHVADQCHRVLSDDGIALLHHSDHQFDTGRNSVAVRERVSWPTGAANCWLTLLTARLCSAPSVMTTDLSFEQRLASRLAAYYS